MGLDGWETGWLQDWIAGCLDNKGARDGTCLHSSQGDAFTGARERGIYKHFCFRPIRFTRLGRPSSVPPP